MFPGHVEYGFGNPTKNFTSSFQYSSSKTPKTKTHWNTLFLESKHAYSDYNPMDTSNKAFETTSNFSYWVLKFRRSESEKKWLEYISVQSEKLQLWRSTRQIQFSVDNFPFFCRKIWVILFEFPKVMRTYSFSRNKIGFPENLLLIT